jgi:D-alanyl-D-alanine carboxypeptidase/D-alanyl-D-alanine-endopeptidase (penicillin-binding protein 4)
MFNDKQDTMNRLSLKNRISFNIYHLTFLIILSSCSLQKQISRSAREDVLTNKALTTAHVGISIYEPAAGKYWFNYQGDHYFVPASNTKLPTCYAAMKYLGDSLTSALALSNDTSVIIIPFGDPSVLYPDFKNQPLVDFLRSRTNKIYIRDDTWREEALGSGWSWNDYQESYMAERSPLPVYGNLLKWIQVIEDVKKPAYIYSIPEINWEVNFNENSGSRTFHVARDLGRNSYTLTEGKERKKTLEVPFVTNGLQAAIELLQDTIHRIIQAMAGPGISRNETGSKKEMLQRIRSQPTDSLLKPMMHRSDNFFAEQSLLMVSNELLGYMNDEKIIDTLLKTDFKDLPQQPRWVDGSGLSRYNLFSPQDFVAILNKMKNDFGMERIKVILPTGGKGTISSYYKADSGYIYGKTGTLSGVVAFSGFLYTRKGKLLIFSTLVNNHRAAATEVRRAVEKFLEGIRNKY